MTRTPRSKLRSRFSGASFARGAAVIVACAAALSLASGPALAAAPDLARMESELTLAGPESPRSEFTRSVARAVLEGKRPHRAWKKGEVPFDAECVSTPGDPALVGVHVEMRMDAPFTQVATTLDQVARFPAFMPDLKSVKVLSRSGSELVTRWERHAPIFFLSNMVWDLGYRVLQPRSDLKVYLFKLRQSDSLRFSDGVIWIEKDGDRTEYSEYNFFEVSSGFFKALALGRIWRDGVESFLRSDFGVWASSANPPGDDGEIPRRVARVMYKRIGVAGLLPRCIR